VRLAPGVILVADKQLEDPNFAKTVVVIADHSDEGTLGLVLNRRSELPLNEVLEKWKEASRVKDPVFVGGPVGRGGMFALLRSKTPPEGAKRVIGDIHLVTDRDGLAPHVSEGPARVRVYAGYTGWAADQLESEIESGGWHVLAANPRLLFDDDPDTLWLRLSRNAEMEVAAMLLCPGCGAEAAARLQHELVPHPMHRDQVLRLALLELGADPGDVIIHRASCRERIVAPHFIQQFIAAHHHALAARQILQNPKFLACHLDRLAVFGRCVAMEINHHIGEAQLA
jgi:putative transcriptional regulator